MTALDVPQMTAAEAEAITEQIVGRLDQVSENIEAVQSLMRDALNRRAHLALGYESPTAYMRDRFEGALVNLSAAMRREIVHELSDAGMSTRAIAPIVGVSQKTVARDVRGESHDSPVLPADGRPLTSDEIEHLLGDETQATVTPAAADARELTPEEVEHTFFGTVNATTGEVVDPIVTEHTVTQKTRIITGLDGKTYTTPTPKRRSLVDDAESVERALFKNVERLREIIRDDRFRKNKTNIQDALRPVVGLAREIFNDLFDNQSQED